MYCNFQSTDMHIAHQFYDGPDGPEKSSVFEIEILKYNVLSRERERERFHW